MCLRRHSWVQITIAGLTDNIDAHLKGQGLCDPSGIPKTNIQIKFTSQNRVDCLTGYCRHDYHGLTQLLSKGDKSGF